MPYLYNWRFFSENCQAAVSPRPCSQSLLEQLEHPMYWDLQLYASLSKTKMNPEIFRFFRSLNDIGMNTHSFLTELLDFIYIFYSRKHLK